MGDLRRKALRLVEASRVRPVMFTSNRGEYIARVSAILEMALDDFDAQQFYMDNVPRYGSTYLTLSYPVDQAWVDQVAEAAVRKIGDSCRS